MATQKRLCGGWEPNDTHRTGYPHSVLTREMPDTVPYLAEGLRQMLQFGMGRGGRILEPPWPENMAEHPPSDVIKVPSAAAVKRAPPPLLSEWSGEQGPKENSATACSRMFAHVLS